ncbi:MAG: type I-G CRISPR-associated RAMP protein Csb1/Cas7g [Acidimicrobiia bacterium]
MPKKILERLREAVTLRSDDAAIRIRATYQPQAGPAAKVFPPTYIASGDGSRYHLEERWGEDGEPVSVVILDSIQSQANRVEQALRENAARLGIPQIIMEAALADRTVRVSSWEAPHRSRDAYLLDSEIDGKAFDKTPLGEALTMATLTDASALLTYSPQDLIFGVWDSHRGKRISLKVPRSYTSEMIGWSVLRGRKAATKGDPLNLPGSSKVPLAEWRSEIETNNRSTKDERLSELGHGMVPVAAEQATGGVSVKAITREAALSLTGLARLSFPAGSGDATPEARVALASLALAGDRLAFGRAGLSLRSGSDLVLASETLQWVGRGNKVEEFELTSDKALDLLDVAKADMKKVGIEWNSEPVTVTPSARLLKVIEQTFYVATLDSE